MKLDHIFRTGNSCDIYIRDTIRCATADAVRFEWDSFPPSQEDIRELLEDVYPQKIFPAMESIISTTYGPGRFVEVVPGVWGWIQGERERIEAKAELREDLWMCVGDGVENMWNEKVAGWKWQRNGAGY